MKILQTAQLSTYSASRFLTIKITVCSNKNKKGIWNKILSLREKIIITVAQTFCPFRESFKIYRPNNYIAIGQQKVIALTVFEHSLAAQVHINY